MPSLVSVEAATGTLQRWETRGEAIRLTHACTLGTPATFTKDVVERFRTDPDEHFAVDPPPGAPGAPGGHAAPAILWIVA